MSREPRRSTGDRPVVAVGSVMAGVAMLTLGDLIAKDLLRIYSPFELILVRGPFAFIPLLIAIHVTKNWPRLLTRRPVGQLTRGLAMATAYCCYLFSLRSLPIADATALMFAAPFMVAGLSRFVLNERVPWPRWAAIAVGFAGVLVIVQPGGAGFRPEGLWALGGAFALALAALLARTLGATEPAPVTTFYTVLMMLALGAAPILADDGLWIAPEGRHVVLMAVAGLIAGAAHFLIAHAYRRGEASLVAPFEYVALPTAALLGYLAFGDVPGREVWAGMALIACAGYLLTRRT